MHNAEEAIKYCSATLKLKVFLTQGVPPTCVSLVLGFRKHFCPPKGFRKEKKVEKHCLSYFDRTTFSLNKLKTVNINYHLSSYHRCPKFDRFQKYLMFAVIDCLIRTV
jgi:hypothetical protein